MARPLDLARRWHDEGLLDDAALATLKERYARDGGDGLAPLTVALLGGAAVVLAAAVVAVPVLMEWSRHAFAWTGLATGAVAAAGAVALWMRPSMRPFGEALGVTSLSLLHVGAWGFMDDTAILLWALGIGSLAVPWLPQRTVLLPAAGVLSIGSGLAGGLADATSEDNGMTVLFVVALALTAAFLAARHGPWRRDGWQHQVAAMVAAAAAVILGLVFFYNHLEWRFPGAPELWVAMVAAPILGGAFVMRDRGVLLVAVIAIAVDAVVFGFDVGALALGIPMLLMVAAGLVALALWAQRAET